MPTKRASSHASREILISTLRLSPQVNFRELAGIVHEPPKPVVASPVQPMAPPTSGTTDGAPGSSGGSAMDIEGGGENRGSPEPTMTKGVVSVSLPLASEYPMGDSWARQRLQ